MRICDRVAKHLEEDGLSEGVEPGEGGAALRPQRVRPVQDLRNPPLLGERRQRNPHASNKINIEVLDSRPGCPTLKLGINMLRTK